MKKTGLLLLVLTALALLSSCGSVDELFIREYRGDEITEIIYESVDYMGGFTDTHKISFTDNKVYFKEDEGEFSEIRSFTDEEESRFLNICYSGGLFGISDRYENKNVMDGGGWSLTVNYKNGKSKLSTGSNASPTSVFSKCAVAFFDLCGERVLGRLPENFLEPPKLVLEAPVLTDDGSINIVVGYETATADFYWSEGRFSAENSDLFMLNEELRKTQDTIDAGEKISIKTDRYENYSGFRRFVLKSYDYNPQLSGERVIADRLFFTSGEFELEPNKIYVYEMHFDNGEYVCRTFNTKATE